MLMNFLYNLVVFFPLETKMHLLVTKIITLLIFAICIYIVGRIFKIISERVLLKRAFNQNGKWHAALSADNVFAAVGYLLAGIIAKYSLMLFFPAEQAGLFTFVGKLLIIYNISCLLIIINSILNIVVAFNARNPNVPVKSTVQVVKMALNLGGLILIAAVFMGKPPLVLVSALGLTASVFMLVFKDTILSLAATYQLSFNDMLRVGDWIEVPKHGADGDVVDISLTTVRVQNWDKTFITFPTGDLVNSSFKNWRGMSESGGRRIKRAINIDMESVRFLEEADIQFLSSIELLKDYLAQKKQEIADHNAKHNFKENIINGRNLTNLGTFRAYCFAYIESRPYIHPGMTTMVRQLESGASGIPLEIYCFTNTTAWVDYENAQSDIFDHLISAATMFDLTVFQNPSSHSLKNLYKGAPQ